MITVSILEDDDIIEADDYVRQLSLTYTGQSDYLETSSTYGGSPQNRLGWIRAWILCPAWVGKTVGEFRARVFKIGKADTETSNYEFVRGYIPDNHLEGLGSEQLKNAMFVWNAMKGEEIKINRLQE